MSPPIKTAAPVPLFIFIVAVLVFHLGLGMGLQLNPALGALLWLAAVAIVAAPVVWLVRSRR